MSSRSNDGKDTSTGRRIGGWRLSTSKALVACQDDSSAPNATTFGTITPSIENDLHDSNEKEHELRIREHIANISNEMITRFLRRSFFQALCDEDLVTAHYCYVATRDDFEQHFLIILQQKFINFRLQREEEERQRQEGKESRSHLKRKGTGADSPCNVSSSSQMANPSNAIAGTDMAFDSNCELNSTYPKVAKTKGRSVGLLQQTMDICDPFTMDDCLDPYDDPYGPSEAAEIDVGEDVNIEDGKPKLDVMNALFKEILCLSTGSRTLNNSTKRKTLTASSSSPSMMTRSFARTNRQRVLETDISGDLSTLNHGNDDAIVDGMADPMEQQIEPLVVTTPLHEIARLGHVELLKCMLQQCRRRRKIIDLDVRNEYGRTVLHNVAGGLVAAEIIEGVSTSIDVDTGNIARNVGIGAPQNRRRKGLGEDTDEETLLSASDGKSPNDEVTVTQRISRIVTRSSRWLSLRNVKSKMNDDIETLQPSATIQRLNNFGEFLIHSGSRRSIPIARIARIETISILLSWRNEVTAETEPPDSEDEVCTEDKIVSADEKQIPFSPYEGDYGSDHISTNAVDAIMNRTALHYAAELGRTDICKSILSAFYGTMLTIVDTAGRTPCELAALNNHTDLASYLEARSLLFVDPYGTEEELLSAISFAEMNHDDVAYYRYNLAAPYCCFETISRDDAKHHREVLIQEATEQIDLHVAEFYEQRRCRLANERKLTSRESLDPPGNSDSTCAPDDSVSVSDPATTDDGQNKATSSNFFEVVSNVDDPPTSNEIEAISPSSDDAIYCRAMEIGIHGGHVEKLLSHHKWLVHDMMKVLRLCPSFAFKEANVPIPQPPPVLPNGSKLDQMTEQYMCLICCDDFKEHSDQWKQVSGCGHGFCADCLVDYITEHTNSSSTGFVIECPHHDCPELISPTVINDVVQKSVHTLDRLRRSAIDAFVVSSYDYTYCPYPGCGENKVIHTLYPMKCYPSNAPALRLIGGVCTNFLSSSSDHKEPSNEPVVLTYESISDPRHYDLMDMVQPKLAHRFCFLCSETRIHWPVTCSQLQEWRSAISEHVGEPNANNETDSSSNYNEVALNIWMKVNTRPCPKCKAPIQKDEGCNHITCCNPHCKHQFCWICRADWSTHNSTTGGNYRCNRWVEQPEHEAYDGQTTIDEETRAMVLAVEETDPSIMADMYGTARHESRVTRQRSSATARFLHHYERWCGQANSASLEHKMRLNLCERLAPVVRNAIEYGGGVNIFGGKGISFLHAAFSELLECRSMLQHSYAFAFVHYKSNAIARQKSNEKVVFERIQSELELLTEQLSDVVARAHIRASETQILFLIKDVSGKRKEFTNFMFGVLRTVDIYDSKKLDPSQTNLPGHRPTSVRSGDYNSDDEDGEAAALAIRQSLDTYDAATNRRFRQTMDDDDDNALHDWACPGCTYMNPGSVRRCDMCDTRRVGE